MNNFRPVLAVESTSELCSVALMTGVDNYCALDIRQKHIHSEKMIPMIKTVLDNSGVKVEELAYAAVSMGPGSFTGLRIGLSAIKGLVYGAGIGICPVPTFEAFAYMICRFIPEGVSFVIAREVNVDEIYCARFVKENNSYKVLNALSIIKKTEFTAYKNENDLVYGSFNSQEKIDRINDVDALSVARWSLIYGAEKVTCDFDYLEPDYLKKFEGRK